MQNVIDGSGRHDGPMDNLCRLAAAIVILLLFSGSPAIAADETASLYTAQVALNPAEPDSRNDAYRNALLQVLIRVTGTTAVTLSEDIAALFPNPARFVLQYRPGPDNTLVVALDGPAIESVLRQNGATIWGSERPRTLFWLAVDWGQGRRGIVAADNPDRVPGDARLIDRNHLLRERVLDVAELRGIPVAFPLLDAEDLENVSFTDIWGGFDEQLLLASERYGADSIVVGRLRVESMLQNRWTWYFSNERRIWNGQPEEIVNLLADSLAARFAYDAGAPVDTIRLTISGITSVDAFGRLQNYLESLQGIDRLMISEVAGDRILYEVQMPGGAERLVRALELSDMLEQVASPLDMRFFEQSDRRYEFDPDARRVRQPKLLEFTYLPN